MQSGVAFRNLQGNASRPDAAGAEEQSSAPWPSALLSCLKPVSASCVTAAFCFFFCAGGVDLCFSKSRPWTSSTGFTWGLVRNAGSVTDGAELVALGPEPWLVKYTWPNAQSLGTVGGFSKITFPG